MGPVLHTMHNKDFRFRSVDRHRHDRPHLQCVQRMRNPN